jgi:hypothetical protein
MMSICLMMGLVVWLLGFYGGCWSGCWGSSWLEAGAVALIALKTNDGMSSVKYV